MLCAGRDETPVSRLHSTIDYVISEALDQIGFARTFCALLLFGLLATLAAHVYVLARRPQARLIHA